VVPDDTLLLQKVMNTKTDITFYSLSTRERSEALSTTLDLDILLMEPK